jgi:hypothetical protein
LSSVPVSIMANSNSLSGLSSRFRGFIPYSFGLCRLCQLVAVS